MTNEIQRIYADDNLQIYKRIGREEKNIPMYFVSGGEYDGVEFKSIRQVECFIKKLTSKII